LLVFGGELRARLAGGSQGGEAMQIRLRTPTGETRIGGGSRGDEPATVQITVAEDSSSTVTVLEGTAEVIVGEEAVDLGKDEVVMLDKGGSVSKPLKRPDTPRLSGPEEPRTYSYRSRTPRIDFQWNSAPNVVSYRWVLARDRGLQDIVDEETLKGTSLSREGLAPGRYYWAVYGLAGSLESEPSRIRTVELVKDEEAPSLVVAWPDAEVSTKSYRLTGVTEPGAQVFVESVPVTPGEEGRFEIDLDLVPGANRVVVESVDAVGNSSYESQIIKAQF
ncbi:MAG: hypothetical protein HKN12_08280, partial [Gemmatimonadetes bacterium]|nr:hypothetical protein [Gemmatimonadota bacterium]